MRILLALSALVLVSFAHAAEPKPIWQAYWLIGGPSEKTGYQHLLITQVSLEDLAKATLPAKPTISILESSAFWIETHGKSSIWNTDLQPIKVAPPMADYRAKERTVRVQDVEYKIEPVPMAQAIRLLKEPFGNGGIHRIHAPLTGMERTATALVALLEAESKT
jgi:hypothetical protein